MTSPLAIVSILSKMRPRVFGCLHFNNAEKICGLQVTLVELGERGLSVGDPLSFNDFEYKWANLLTVKGL